MSVDNDNNPISEQIFERYFEILKDNKEITKAMIDGLNELRKNNKLDDLGAIKSVLGINLGDSDENN